MNMDKRQKVIALFLVIAVVVLAWQVYDLVGDKGGSLSLPGRSLKQASDPTAVVKPMISVQPAVAPMTSTSSGSTTPYQKQYMKLVNEYQLLQMQGMIAQQQATIAKSRAQTAEALSKINDLSGAGDASIADLNVATPATNESGDYELIYTGQENGQWTATLKKGGQFNDVTAGSVLPDGTKVLSVDDNGVLIDENNVKKIVTFNGITPFTAPAPSAPAPTPVAVAPIAVAPVVAHAAPVVAPAPVVVAKPVALVAPAKKPTAAEVASAPLAPKVVATSPPAFDITTANKNHYTVQLIANKTEDTVSQFIEQNKLGGKALSIKTKTQGKLWYIGVYGDFLTVDEANKAIEGLPSTAKTEGPFVRRIGNVLKGVVK
ncbi:MAG TPA: SPOR domain-containing protein [Gammaproteobacteria bacterium]|nr:SPOR domain-containing protein [Gammaproteobacteria bacterium]